MNLGNVMIFGDSYSTYAGYIPEGYAVYYSGSRETPPDLPSAAQTWWGRLLEATDSVLVQNNSWSGSTIGYTGYMGDCSTSSSFIYRFEKLLAEGFFEQNSIDTLLVFGGTNDSWSEAPLGELKYDGIEREDLFCVLPAISYFAKRLKEALPTARIVFIANSDIKEEIIDAIQRIAEHYGLESVALTGIAKVNRHPDELGMEQICAQVLSALARQSKHTVRSRNMEYRVLGKTGLEISRLGFGGIPIQKIDADGTRKLIGDLIREGVNFIDTARGYTVSEEYLGYALEGVRDRFVLATKSMARTKDAMARDVDVSLKNLRTDYIDLYQIHNPNAKDLEQVMAPDGALEALCEARTAGKIGHIGVTLHSVELFERAIDLPWVETIMFPYNIVETQGEELIERCAERNIGFICMKPLAGGAIEDAATAMRFVVSNPNVTVVIPGMADAAEIAQNVAAVADTAPLNAEEQVKVGEIKALLGTNFCRRCNYCAPCAAGINIPAVFLFEGYYSRYDLKDWASDRYSSLAKTASDCIGCGACESRCPYDLPIREMLKKAAAVMGK